MHWQVRCWARCLNFGLNLYLHPFYVSASSKGSGEAAYMHRQSGHGLIKYSIRIKSRMSWPICLLSNHFLIKCSRSSLFSDQNKLMLVAFNGQHMSFGTYRTCVNSLSSGAQFLHICQSLYLYLSYVSKGSECPGEAAHTSRRLWALVDQKFN